LFSIWFGNIISLDQLNFDVFFTFCLQFALVFLQEGDDEGNADNLEALKMMRKVEQKIKFRATKN
jgi:hypothetical protein